MVEVVAVFMGRSAFFLTFLSIRSTAILSYIASACEALTSLIATRSATSGQIRLFISKEAALSHRDRPQNSTFDEATRHAFRTEGRHLADVDANYARRDDGRERASFSLVNCTGMSSGTYFPPPVLAVSIPKVWR